MNTLDIQHHLGRIPILGRRAFAGLNHILIPAGKFLTGEGENKCTTHITQPYWMGVAPITQSTWQEIMGYNPSTYKSPLCPVTNVSWNDCQEFCTKIGNGLRLPTEAEWERACRCNAATTHYSEEILGQYAWFAKNSEGHPHTVATKLPNIWGLYDMLGNVCEWCQDSYTTTLVGGINPRGPNVVGGARVVRGASVFSSANECRIGFRLANSSSDSGRGLGFRTARSYDPSEEDTH